tara:strand:+ start:185 stop:442 length:258 start_codon:yes stop_codon:yes gene_type:complete
MKDNKIIAEFMGHKPKSILGHGSVYNDYSKSWDLLMPVAKRCMNIAYGMDCSYWHELLMDSAVTYKKEPIYQAVVEFIKFYNQNK